VYGTRAILRDLPQEGRKFPRQALHAAAIEFCHPATQISLSIVAPYPSDLAWLIKTLQLEKEEGKENLLSLSLTEKKRLSIVKRNLKLFE
jgi:hypothetical protein